MSITRIRSFCCLPNRAATRTTKTACPKSIDSPWLFSLAPGRVGGKGVTANTSAIYSSTSSVTTSSTGDGENDDENASSTEEVPTKPLWRKLLVRAALSYVVFACGFILGRGGSIKATARNVPSRFPVLSAIGVLLILKEFWNATPIWIKQKVPLGKRKQYLLDKESAKESDPDDMTNVGTIGLKLKGLFAVAQTKLDLGEEEKKLDVLPPLLALVTLTRQLRLRGNEEEEQRYKAFAKAGEMAKPKEVQELQETFEYADWAYDESPDGRPLKELLRQDGFTLLRHDKTTLPGYVGHYVAINPKTKCALVGVKGTSTFEDLLTDCCGLAVSHTLPSPFVEGGTTEIQCHEGVLISSKRLTDDLQAFVQELLLPQGFQVLLVGHSLGAAAASLLGVMLRSRIPELRLDTQGKKLRVLAFASPPVLNYDAALECKSFCTTIINNSDIIPRASLANLVIGLEELKLANDKLQEKTDGEMNRQALIRKLLKESVSNAAVSNAEQLLMKPDEYADMKDQAIASVEKRDPDHLLCLEKWCYCTTANQISKRKRSKT